MLLLTASLPQIWFSYFLENVTPFCETKSAAWKHLVFSGNLSSGIHEPEIIPSVFMLSYKLFLPSVPCNSANDDCPASRLNIQYITRPLRHLMSWHHRPPRNKAGLAGNGFLKVPLLYSRSKTKQGQSWECVWVCWCVSVLMSSCQQRPLCQDMQADIKDTHTDKNTSSLWSSFNCWSYELFVNPIDLRHSF